MSTSTIAVYHYFHYIAKNVKYPFEMTRSASSNDPKYLSENERVPLLPRRP